MFVLERREEENNDYSYNESKFSDVLLLEFNAKD